MPHFECDGCGACCKTFPVFAAESDAGREPLVRECGKRLPPHLATDRWSYRLFPLPFHDRCCFLDAADRCTVYPTRPDACRAFAAGSDQCRQARAAHGLPPLAPP